MRLYGYNSLFVLVIYGRATTKFLCTLSTGYQNPISIIISVVLV